ncbi:permease-like cell division protein FtsX [Congregibacter litoralis]|uniref:Cell division protein FtsX n=1 Tax=Congregibacter litoralis KT71 TaxID=314285 RepID=A4A9C5_9GAMM|nr:permease-like cell division protein FtsX [Congregibacter litoralis]EAQ97667.1 cell division protein FtsX [Congregibacter litoralis KT71]
MPRKSRNSRKSNAPGNARPRRIRWAERWRGWRRHHSQSAAESLAKVLQQPLSSCMTWLVIGIAIALPSGLWVVLDNVTQLGDQLERPAQLSLFLKADVEADEASRLALDLALRENILSTEFVDRDEALAEFVARSGMGELAQGLSENPLPHLLLVVPLPASPEALGALRGELEGLPAVEEALLDTLWLQRLQSLMTLGRRAVQLLALLLLAAVVLVLGNTIRLAIESRRDEIVIVKLVGGSDAFVRRPLLYTGLWFGLGGGVVAALLVAAGTFALASPVNALSAAYQSTFVLRGLGIVDSLQLVLVGAALGLGGAWLAVARHLKAIEPR